MRVTFPAKRTSTFEHTALVFCENKEVLFKYMLENHMSDEKALIFLDEEISKDIAKFTIHNNLNLKVF